MTGNRNTENKRKNNCFNSVFLMHFKKCVKPFLSFLIILTMLVSQNIFASRAEPRKGIGPEGRESESEQSSSGGSPGGFITKTGPGRFKIRFNRGAPEKRGVSETGEKAKAAEEKKDSKDPLAGWAFTSKGGLAYESPNDEKHWIELSGVIRFDEVFFSGSNRDKFRRTGLREFANGGNLRLVELYLDSGLGEDWLSTLGVTYLGDRIALADTWIGYTGFSENSELNIGRHSGNWFGLENSSSTSWNPFLERSLAAFAFYPGDGIGVLGDMWWKDGEATLILIQPDHGANVFTEDGTFLPRRGDRWRAIARGSYSPLHEKGNVWHFGLSYAHRRHDFLINGIPISDLGLRAHPGLRSRVTTFLLNTGFINAKYAHQYNVEFARQCGPLLVEADYYDMYIYRYRTTPGPLRFHGWAVQGRYMLTGESHNYDVRDGSFGSVDIASPCGAFEVAARYDFLNLNNKDVQGGSQHNVTLGFNWFINPQMRFSFNYIRGTIVPSKRGLPVSSPFRRHLDMFGVRLQLRFK